jgi:hypothetical protein
MSASIFRRFFIPALFFGVAFCSVHAQAEGWSSGYIVPLEGDTLFGFIKDFKEDRLGRTIYFSTNPEESQERFQAIALKGFGANGLVYETGNVEGRANFLKIEERGDIMLYSFSFREKKGSKYETVVQRYVRLTGSSSFALISKKNFKTELPIHIQDHPDLADRVRNREYSYDQLAEIIADYNEWANAGKPRKSWERVNGNYTLPKEEKEESSRSKADLPPVYSAESDGKRLGIEAMGFFNYSLLMQYGTAQYLTTNVGVPGPTFMMGVGARYRLGKSFTLRGGLQYNYRVSSFIYEDSDSSNMIFRVTEKWNVGHISSYIHFDYEVDNAFFGLGVALGVFHHRSGRKDTYSSGGVVPIKINEPLEASGLIDRFNGLADLVLNTGLIFYNKDRTLRFKPTFKYNVPINQLFTLNDSGIGGPFPEGSGVGAHTIQLGLIFDFTP